MTADKITHESFKNFWRIAIEIWFEIICLFYKFYIKLKGIEIYFYSK